MSPPEEQPLMHYVIFRKGMTRSQVAVQGIHGGGESAFSGPVQPSTHAIALELDREPLLLLEADLKARGVRFVAIREPDPPWLGELVALALEPAPRAERRFLQGIPKLRD